jgi:hypothetical protein
MPAKDWRLIPLWAFFSGIDLRVVAGVAAKEAHKGLIQGSRCGDHPGRGDVPVG